MTRLSDLNISSRNYDFIGVDEVAALSEFVLIGAREITTTQNDEKQEKVLFTIEYPSDSENSKDGVELRDFTLAPTGPRLEIAKRFSEKKNLRVEGLFLYKKFYPKKKTGRNMAWVFGDVENEDDLQDAENSRVLIEEESKKSKPTSPRRTPATKSRKSKDEETPF